MDSDIQQLEDKIGLPPILYYKPRQAENQYGSSIIMARYCKLNVRPNLFPHRYQHGWSPSFYKLHPFLVMQEEFKEFDHLLVGRQNDASYLKSLGYSATAIGLPFVYAESIKPNKRLGSLLVMPSHFSMATQRFNNKIRDYVDYIESIRRNFSEVVVCIQAHDVKKGMWLNEFKAIGINIIRGASSDDQNALERLKRIFGYFDYMTTNKFGSHVPYACAEGCKVNISGPWIELTSDYLLSFPFYQRNEQLIDEALEVNKKYNYEQNYPFLFSRSPLESKCQNEWGEKEIGVANKLAPKDMKALFQWNNFTVLVDNIRLKVVQCSNSTKRAIKNI
jgi:hypothetical protein